MFGRKNKKEVDPKGLPANKSLALNTIVEKTIVEGDIQTEDDIRIDGTLLGNLKCSAKLIIGPTGKVKGDVTCQNAMIEGKFEGKIEVAEILSLKEHALINGDASYDKLVVHQGAVINATIRRNGNESAPANKTTKNSDKKAQPKEEVGV